ncbi:terminase small subunit, Nu1 [Granulicella tundricola]|uniref:Putative terminase small subunit, Nu1 n=1 Tax=Granulicella tundricola (strain ATCC BAA-1859 / DSM 23138 / MP5ACTX9) TaxID=1198114 RepID=E8X2N4_GRATM|nr:terminase small subunit, Nu1 [Granulicella tundricola]ADW70331.1 putative terminase small subunit, Nu1 [Granulicella tundricola MP5ACTX9]
MKEQRLVSVTEIRTILAGKGHPMLSKQAITNFVKDGMPKRALGKYDRDECLAWYVGRLRTNVLKQETESRDGQVISLDKARARLVVAQAENEEMTALERKGKLIPLELYETEGSRWALLIKTNLLNLPSRLGPNLVGLTAPEIKALLNASMVEFLARLVKVGPGSPAKQSEVGAEARKTLPSTTKRNKA